MAIYLGNSFSLQMHDESCGIRICGSQLMNPTKKE